MELTFRKGKGKATKQTNKKRQVQNSSINQKIKQGQVAEGVGSCFRWGDEGAINKEARCGPRAERQGQVQCVTSSAEALRPRTLREKSCSAKCLPLIQQRP